VNKIIFVHIPKTAGTSLTEYLCGFYEQEKVYDGVTMLDYQNAESEHLVRFDLLKGHIFYHYIEQNSILSDYHLITVLRHPVERVISLYRFWRSHTQEFAQDETIHPAIRGRVLLAKSQCLYDFVHSDEIMVRNSICNSQARQLSSRVIFEDFHQQPIDVIYKDVSENLNQFSVVGLTDFLPFFYQALHQRFGFSVPDQPIRTNVSNTSEVLWRTLNQQHQIAAKIIELNQVDMKLYAYYREKLHVTQQ
jgi:hypothetical protein